jgi:hypothetical protein
MSAVPSENKNTHSRTRLGAVLLGVYLVCVVPSGFAWPLGYGQYALWPFCRAWWMFSRDDGKYYHLRFAVKFADGRRDEADPDRWFVYPASESTRRYDELGRGAPTLRKLVRYLCTQHNTRAAVSERWTAITVTDTSWAQTVGRRVSYRETPFVDLHVNDLLVDEPCPEQP